MQLSELKGKESACLISKLNVKGFMPPPPSSLMSYTLKTLNYTVIRQKLVCWLYKSEFRISGLVLSDVLQQLAAINGSRNYVRQNKKQNRKWPGTCLYLGGGAVDRLNLQECRSAFRSYAS